MESETSKVRRNKNAWKYKPNDLVKIQPDGSSMHCYESAKSLLIVAWSHGCPNRVATQYRVKKSVLRKLVKDRGTR